jgi:prepilin peptidase CpaA
MQKLILLFAVGLFAVIADSDVRRRRIPNELTAGVAGLGLVRMFLAGDPIAALHTLAAAGAVFGAAFLLFRRGLVGGGDVKLLAAAALLVGDRDLFGFLFLMSLCGALVALAIVVGHRLDPQASREGPWRTSVPYGVAIGVASVLTLIFSRVPG